MYHRWTDWGDSSWCQRRCKQTFTKGGGELIIFNGFVFMLRWEGDVRNERHTTPSSIQLPKKTMCSHVQRLTHMHRLWHLFHCAGVYGIVTAAGLNHSGRKMKRGEGVTVLSTVLVLSVLYSPAEAVICHHQLKGVKSFVESEHLHLHNQMCTPNPRWDAEKAKVKNFFASELPPERLSVSLSPSHIFPARSPSCCLPWCPRSAAPLRRSVLSHTGSFN